MLDECSELLVTYRERVTEHWQDLAMQVPVAFPLAGPCEVVIVATLMRYWVFTRLATTDQIRLESHWEDDELDTWKSFQAPLEVASEHVVSRFLGASPEWQEVEAGNLRGYVLADTYRVFQHLEDPGHVMTDEHAGVAQLMDGFESLTGERVDRKKLAEAQERLRVTTEIRNPQERGKAFESVLAAALEAHGCTVELGKTFGGEQIDVFITKPQVAVVEVRWTKEPQERSAVDILAQETLRRPPLVSGLYVSMAGFPSEGAKQAALEGRDRCIFLMDGEDVNDLFSGRKHFSEFW